ncbi:MULTISPECIES: AraC family transcriptional regulator [Sphingomonadales]|uniref:AraC family transcriptional regulator n=1 Tax=Sphingomonadales TaxID=204457 RepID=UPI0009BCB3F8|nr:MULTISPECIES: helix-turn-helix domain-containing protein [Sphingomonadales]
MTAWDQVDQMARGGSIALLAQWSWILVRDHWRDVPARLAVAMNVGICSYLIITAGIFGKPSLIGLLFALGAGATPGLFWLFAKAWFNDEKRVAPISALLVGLSVANTLVVQLTYPHGGTANAISAVLFRASMLTFAGAALWEVWRSREGDLVERRRRIRPVLVCVVAICVISIAFVEVAASPGTPAASWRLAVATGSLLAVFSFCAVLLRMRQGDMFGPVESTGVTAKTPRNLGEDPLAARLLQFMAAQMPYRDETMSIAKLAALLGEQEYRLRRTINGQLGHRNFSSFLNSYRLSEVKSALADPSQRDVPIITIALDAGFGSLGPFNRAFREAEGMTPSEYRARHLTDSGIG